MHGKHRNPLFGRPIDHIRHSPVLLQHVEALQAMGARHQDCAVHEFYADEQNLIASTPAYMLDARISEVAEGIEKLVTTVVGWCRVKGNEVSS